MITKQQAIAIAESGLWQDIPVRERCWLMLESRITCYPFEQFHADIEAELGRPVWTNEFGINPDGLRKEFLGQQEPPTLEAVLDLLPKGKAVIIKL